ncbi:hypothetical protein DB032_06710 [Chromobacterium sp. Panama]|uniref:DNA/RNA helicase domain-containing protein n=1 Tax=Chromobacterium sp. Panama TaxID=2161826 RepID=UPI000D31B1DE|nr:DNA/RNA helicase domain-containing protein [Chromobacterium sp. Panama]PTU64627.1 hypothetical protein DB032_06710 [Chromobacterium sp. Panama]
MTALATLTIQEFCEKAKNPSFPDELEQRYAEVFEQSPLSPQEKSSWTHSLPALAALLESQRINGHILLEYPMPLGTRRADCVLIGADADDNTHILIIELKQWSQGSISLSKSDEPRSLTVHAQPPYSTEHPCDQAQVYMTALEHMLDFGSHQPVMHAMAYLHNYREVEDDLLRSHPFASHLQNALLLTLNQGQEAAASVLGQLQQPSSLLPFLCNPVLHYSDAFIANFSDKLNCSALFEPSAEQEQTFRKILSVLDDTKHRSCVVIKGIVGTGKTVLAMMLIRHLMQQRKNPKYYVISAAIKDCLRALDFSAGGPASTKYLIVDEAHRLNGKFLAQLFKNKQLIVFFIDDNQWLQPNENCRSADLSAAAQKEGMQLIQHTLSVQLRCRGADNYIAWVDRFLNHGKLDTLKPDTDFEVQLVDNPQQMENLLRQRAQGNTSCRMVAGYCWDWSTIHSPPGEGHDIEIEDWTARWNQYSAYADWNQRPGFHTEVGAIYTVQGFEYDYVGVIIGPDLIHTSNGLRVRPSYQKYKPLQDSLDRPEISIPQRKQEFAKAVRNIYYVLLTRAKKGVFIYATNPELRNTLQKLKTLEPT